MSYGGNDPNAEIFAACDLAFKIRGATNTIRSLLQSTPASQLTVVTHSSGNHAQALALAAKQLGVRAHVVMPNTSSPVKKAAVRGYGAVVTECVPTLQAREDTAKTVMGQESTREAGRRVEFVPPYDDGGLRFSVFGSLLTSRP
jgi:threonine dehydratase